jgi:hypothetical protein
VGVLYEIVKKLDHYEVYIEDEFHCSVDNLDEAYRELKAYFKAEK